MPLAKQNTVTRMHFTVFASDGITPLTGQSGACTDFLARNGTAAPEAVVISEIGVTGHYYATFTPLNTGIYDLEVTCPDNRVMGENYEVQAADLDDIDAKTTNLPDYPEWFIAKSGLVIAGSSTTEIRTDFIEADDFFNNMQVVVINAAGVIARNVHDYANVNGAITVEALPFTPANNDDGFIVSRTGSVPIDPSGIADAVWDELMAGHIIDGSFGLKLQKLRSSAELP